MSDRHLYKAKRTDNGEWVEGYYTYYPNGMNDTEETKHVIRDTSTNPGKLYFVDPSTICQCTGLKTRNGKLIWENDIVAFNDMYSTESGYAEMDCIGKVGWDSEELCFYVTERLSAESWEVLQECYVIGNIFDNPELLEGAKEATDQGNQDLLMPGT